MPQPSLHAVITGDLIGSTRLPADRAEAAFVVLERSAAPDMRFTRFRGDGWQVFVTEPADVLRQALGMAATLAAAGTGLRTRIAIGIGTVISTGTANLSDASGSAFIRSGRALDALPRGKVWTVRGGPNLPPWVEGLVDLAEWHAAGWTAGQAEVVADWLTRPATTQEERAARLGLSRQAWKHRFDGSGIAAWEQALRAWDAWNGAGITDD